jgi:hypothetical protein
MCNFFLKMQHNMFILLIILSAHFVLLFVLMRFFLQEMEVLEGAMRGSDQQEEEIEEDEEEFEEYDPGGMMVNNDIWERMRESDSPPVEEYSMPAYTPDS